MNTVLGQIAVLDCLPCPIWLLCLDCFLCRYRLLCWDPPLYWDPSLCWDTSLLLDWWLDPAAFNWLARFAFKWSESEKQNTASIYSKNAGSWKYRKMLRDLTEFTHNVVDASLPFFQNWSNQIQSIGQYWYNTSIVFFLYFYVLIWSSLFCVLYTIC